MTKYFFNGSYYKTLDEAKDAARGCCMFDYEFENKPIKWWLRLHVVNIFSFIMIIILICIEETYLTFHPQDRTRWIKSSILQYFFE